MGRGVGGLGMRRRVGGVWGGGVGVGVGVGVVGGVGS